jgi:hypothetical protein
VANLLDEQRQFVLLFRSFFARLFESDLTPEGFDASDAIAWLVPIFAAPAAMVSLWLFPKYALVVELVPEQFAVASRPDWLFFVGYSMAAVGLLTVLVWEALFPDRRDLLVLGPLPVRARVVVLARISSILALVLGFAVAIHVPSTALFTLAAAGSGTIAEALGTFTAGFVAMVSAGGFTFLALVALHATLILVVPRRAARAISTLAQLLFVTVLLEWLFFAPGLLTRLTGNEPGLLGHGASGFLPPLWFLGLYEVLVGSGEEGVVALSRTAVIAMAVALGIALASYGLAYRRLASPELARARRLRTLELGSPRHPAEKAIFQFVIKSLARSRRHRLAIAAYLAVGFAFVLGGLLEPLVHGDSPSSSAIPTVTALSVPLLLSFFSLVALRVLFDVPTELRANWIFQMTESDDKRAYSMGIRKAMHFLALAPIALATLPVYWFAWGARLAIGYTIFWFLLGALLAELLMVGFHKLPFTSAYAPGEANVKLLWPVYFLGMLAYSYGTPRIGLSLLADLPRLVAALAALALVLAAAVAHRHRVLSSSGPFSYRGSEASRVPTLGLTPGVPPR